MFARVVSLMNGRSGLRPEVLTFLCDMLNNGITPLLPKEGGEGPSLAKAVLGAGSCMFKGEVRCVLHACGSGSLIDPRESSAARRLDYIRSETTHPPSDLSVGAFVRFIWMVQTHFYGLHRDFTSRYGDEVRGRACAATPSSHPSPIGLPTALASLLPLL